jgi:starch synthase
MYILMIGAELAPVAKVGGLADVIAGLGRELAAQGHRLEVLLPRYDTLQRDDIWDLTPLQELWVPHGEDWVHCQVASGQVAGLDCCFLDLHAPGQPFRRGRLYGEADDPARFALFSRAALEFLHKSGRQPDILHCHDWHTGLVPVLLRKKYLDSPLAATRVCYTLHNLGHQGCGPAAVLDLVGLEPAPLMVPGQLQDPRDPRLANPMLGGIRYADYVTTVSPRYAWEVCHGDQGQGLEAALRTRGKGFGGILNGIDYATWSPASDPHIPFIFAADTLARKARNKTALRQRLGLADAARPLVAVVSRLDAQKGPELIQHALTVALAREAQFVLLGTVREAALEAEFQALARRHEGNPQCRVCLAHDEELAHQIFAGADILVVPSRFEPCGLTQLIAMRYGVVPVVRRVGGLADTVVDANAPGPEFHARTGYCFDEYSETALESALGRAIGLWREHPAYFRQLRLNGMARDHSWTEPARQYVDLYAHLLGDAGTGAQG